jgi:hypothetical protein
MNMKTIVLFVSLCMIFSCQKSNWMIPSETTQNQLPIDTNDISEQNALGIWLMSQSQQVRDDFKRDFTFSGQDIKALVDSLKANSPNNQK